METLRDGSQVGRLTETQKIFRRANERLRQAVEGAVSVSKPIPFVCECVDESCMSAVDLTIEEYRAVSSQPGRYAVVPGHAGAEGETVAERHDRYQVVERTG